MPHLKPMRTTTKSKPAACITFASWAKISMSSPLKMKNACLEALAIQRARARQKQRRHKRDWNFGVSPSCVKFRSADGAEITPTSRAFVATARTPTVSICALVDRNDKKTRICRSQLTRRPDSYGVLICTQIFSLFSRRRCWNAPRSARLTD